jgi:cytochrome c550
LKRSPLLPFGIIMIVGVLVMLLLSFKGIGDSRDLAAELEGGDEQTDEVAANPAMGTNTKVVEVLLH